jgi:chromosome segregation ATPase
MLDREMLCETFHQWQCEEQSLDAQWNESLAALAAYQSHLDAWQQQLCRERDELRQARDEWSRDQAAAELSREQSSSQALAQLAEAREKVAQLSEQLLARTEELRVLDQRRAELATELELTRANAKQIAAELDEQRRMQEQERAAATQQLHQMQQLIDQQAERVADVTPKEPAQAGSRQEQVSTPDKAPRKPAVNSVEPKRSTASPVLGSIVEQFGKLRQQRASERQAGKK